MFLNFGQDFNKNSYFLSQSRKHILFMHTSGFRRCPGDVAGWHLSHIHLICLFLFICPPWQLPPPTLPRSTTGLPQRMAAHNRSRKTTPFSRLHCLVSPALSIKFKYVYDSPAFFFPSLSAPHHLNYYYRYRVSLHHHHRVLNQSASSPLLSIKNFYHLFKIFL